MAPVNANERITGEREAALRSLRLQRGPAVGERLFDEVEVGVGIREGCGRENVDAGGRRAEEGGILIDHDFPDSGSGVQFP